jgi:pyruvate, orthophosphate dikinase
VFGHRDARSGTGVVFSRDPSTGAPGATGDWLPQAQGEAVVAGTHATQSLATLAEHDPASHDALLAALDRLELYYRDMVDVEFTIESGRLWILQARPGKRTGVAAARIACDLVDHPGIRLSQCEALARVPAHVFEREIHTQSGISAPLCRGLGVSPGLVSGRVAVDCDQAISLAEDGEDVILVRAETSPEDVHGMGVAVGILTATGGMVSHAALVAREWGIAAVCSAPIVIDDRGFSVGLARIATGDTISIDGATGDVFHNAVRGARTRDPHVERLRGWTLENSKRETVHG